MDTKTRFGSWSSRLTLLRSSRTRLALAGQTRTQVPQATHFSGTILA